MGRVSRGTGLAPHSNCVRGSPILGRLDRTIALAELELVIAYAPTYPPGKKEGKQAETELVALIAKLLKKYKGELPPPEPLFNSSLIPVHLEEFLENKEANAASTVVDEDHAHVHSVEKASWERDGAAALEETDLDLVRLDRYERRALSQQKRAILEFMNIKLLKKLRGRKAETQFAAE